MSKYKTGSDEDRRNPKANATGGNNVEAPVEDDGRESGDQERAVGDSGDRDTRQRASQQGHSDSTDPESTARAAAGHRSGGPASSDKDSNESAGTGTHRGQKARKDRHGGVSLDDEAKERQTGEGGPANSAPRPRGQPGHAGRQ